MFRRVGSTTPSSASTLCGLSLDRCDTGGEHVHPQVGAGEGHQWHGSQLITFTFVFCRVGSTTPSSASIRYGLSLDRW